MLSGMVTVSLYPLAAHVNAKPMPVLPDVGSMISVFLLILPFFSASSIIATPMRSFTDQSGLKFSIFATTVPGMPAANRRTLDQRRVADAFRDAVVNSSAETISFCHDRGLAWGKETMFTITIMILRQSARS